MKVKDYKHFAPQKEVEYFTIVVDGKKMSESLPYVGDKRGFLDSIKGLKGITVEPASADDIRRGNHSTKLHKRVIKAFEKAWDIRKGGGNMSMRNVFSIIKTALRKRRARRFSHVEGDPCVSCQELICPQVNLVECIVFSIFKEKIFHEEINE